MHEIVLRGKRIDSGEWVEGSLLVWPDGRTEILQPDSDDHKCWVRIRVYTDSVGQYTGLTDNNGTKIFEGDIIKNHDFNAEDGGYGVVEYNDGAFEINGNGISGTFHENYWGKECEVVGNIFDNPETTQS